MRASHSEAQANRFFGLSRESGDRFAVRWAASEARLRALREAEMDEIEKQYWTAGETAKALKRSLTSVYRLCAAGLPHRKIGGKLLFDPEKVRQWVESQPGVP